MRIALVHDYLNQMGGAERVVEEFHALYPDAPVYTSLYNPDVMPESMRAWDVRTSFLQRLPLWRRLYRLYLPLFPCAFESFDLSEYDVVLSSTTAWAKGVVTLPDTLHICYINTPTRFAWRYHEYVRHRRLPPLVARFLPLLMSWIRVWDAMSAARVDLFIANSENVRRRVAKYYRRPSVVVHPPVRCDRFRVADERGDYFLVVGRLKEYKGIDLAITAFNRLRLPLWIIGEGEDRRRLERLAGPTVRLLGRVGDDRLREVLSRCRALVFPGEEDFGIAPLEAQACGRPVIALARGGVMETVVPANLPAVQGDSAQPTGLFFTEASPEALAEVVSTFRDDQFDPAALRRHAEGFDAMSFRERIGEIVERARRLYSNPADRSSLEQELCSAGADGGRIVSTDRQFSQPSEETTR